LKIKVKERMLIRNEGNANGMKNKGKEKKRDGTAT